MQCATCATTLTPGAAFCGNCGASVATPASPPSFTSPFEPGPTASAPGGPGGSPFGDQGAGAYGNPGAGAYGNPGAGAYGNPGAGAYGNPGAGAYGNPRAGAYGAAGATAFGAVYQTYGAAGVQFAVWMRLLAYIIDALILGVVNVIIGLPLSLVAGAIGLAAGSNAAGTTGTQTGTLIAIQGISILINVAVSALYFALMESSKYQGTVGKIALKLKVVDYNFERITFPRAVGRYFAKFLSGIILLIGYAMIIWDPKHEGLHDKLAKTYVLQTS